MTVIKLYWTKQGKCKFITLPSATESAQAEKRALKLRLMSDANLEYFYATQSNTPATSAAHMAKYEEHKALARSVV